MHLEKQLIQIFKTFVEKTFLPALRKTDNSMQEWNKFASMLSVEQINFNQLQYYVETLQSSPPGLPTYEKKDSLRENGNNFFMRKR